MADQLDTRTRILDSAQSLLETRGFNAFSYQDIADELGIKKASLHYHFPSKTHLGAALAQRHADQARAILAELDAAALSPAQMLDGFIRPFIDIASSCKRMCPGGMLAAEFSTLAPDVQSQLQSFFHVIHSWLCRLLSQGRESGAFAFDGTPDTRADIIISTLEGAILLARIRQNPEFLDPLVADIKASIAP